MLLTVVGLALLALGIGGVRYAPAIVAAQRRQGMAPFADDETIETSDRVRVIQGTSLVLAIGGAGCIAYGAGIV